MTRGDSETVTIDAQLNASILAPFATLNGNRPVACNLSPADRPDGRGAQCGVHRDATGRTSRGQDKPCPGAAFADAAGHRRDVAGRSAAAEELGL